MPLLLQDGSYLLLQEAGEPAGKLLLKGDPGAVFHALAPAWRTANFGDGTNVVSWGSPLDPSERKTYTVDASQELNGINDRIKSVTVVLSGLAALSGLTIYGVTNDNTNVTIWFEIAPEDRARPGWTPPGEVHIVTVTVTSMDGHIFQRDASLRISEL
jgi:hypothetical protein